MHLQIAFIISLFGLCITMPIFVRYFAYSGYPTWAKMLGFFVCLFIAGSPIFAARNFSNIFGNYFSWVEYAIYFVYIFAIITFTLTFLRDIVWIILSLFKCVPSPFKTAVFNPINWATLAIALICAIWSLYEGMKVPAYRHVTLTSPKIQQEKTIVLLSDLHISRTINPAKIQQIVARTNAIHPDLILLAGDNIDDQPSTIQQITALLAGLKAKQGIYFVSGNHEFYVGYREAMDTLANLGLISLENKKIQLSRDLTLVGISDSRTTGRFRMPDKTHEVLSDISPDSYTILVSHSPTPMDLPYDLQVSGHTHGGQILPFHFFSWLSNHHLLAGWYPNERIYVSRGAGQWGPQMRFFAPSEITVIHLKQK